MGVGDGVGDSWLKGAFFFNRGGALVSVVGAGGSSDI